MIARQEMGQRGVRGAVRALAAVGALAAGLGLLPGCQEGASAPSGDADGAATADGGAVDSDAALDGGVVDDAEEPDGLVEPDAVGGFGAPCQRPGDCESGWCVESPDGLVCTTSCTAECPTGWDCKGVQNGAGDPTYICINLSARLCNPCASDEDCSPAGSSGQNLCLPQGSDGSFCGLDCGSGGACPEGYECDDSLTVPQCRPVGGACACSEMATDLALSTPCSVSNDSGECWGARTCAEDGLSACDASPPSPEVCNGVDDDCDGETDEDLTSQPCTVDNEFGSCPGEEFCTAGEPKCVGQEAVAETCNALDDDCDGETDEGFPDTDEDGTPDCRDDDDDGDGSLDAVDCEPLNAAAYPGGTETCDGADNDCDGVTDNPGAEGCSPFFPDVDQDGHGALGSNAVCLCAADPGALLTATEADDCLDQDPHAYPGASELCNGQDDDCDGETDEAQDMAPCPITNEYGTCEGVSLCQGGVVVCDGTAAGPEVCNGQDDDCDGATDEGLPDNDADGVADCVDEDDDNDGDPDVTDCAPMDPAISASATESCGDGVDQDCDGQTDEEGAAGCTVFFQDADLDHFGANDVDGRCLCGPQPVIYFTETSQGDCDDKLAAVNPNATEVCNGADDNCDGNTDEGVQSPCGTCGTVCVMDAGQGQTIEFAPDGGNSAGLELTAQGALTLAAGETGGFYRVRFHGWPDAPADWGLLILTMDLSAGDAVSVDVRVRTSASEAALGQAPWDPTLGPFPPESFPVTIGKKSNWIELELQLATTDAAQAPVVSELTLFASKGQ